MSEISQEQMLIGELERFDVRRREIEKAIAGLELEAEKLDKLEAEIERELAALKYGDLVQGAWVCITPSFYALKQTHDERGQWRRWYPLGCFAQITNIDFDTNEFRIDYEMFSTGGVTLEVTRDMRRGYVERTS